MRALSLALSPFLSPPSLSLSLSLSPRSLARSLGVCVHARMRRCVNEAFRNGDTSADVSRSKSHKTRAFRDGGASADVSRHRGLGQCNYVELIDTIFTDVEGVD